MGEELGESGKRREDGGNSTTRGKSCGQPVGIAVNADVCLAANGLVCLSMVVAERRWKQGTIRAVALAVLSISVESRLVSFGYRILSIDVNIVLHTRSHLVLVTGDGKMQPVHGFSAQMASSGHTAMSAPVALVQHRPRSVTRGRRSAKPRAPSNVEEPRR